MGLILSHHLILCSLEFLHQGGSGDGLMKNYDEFMSFC